MNEINYRKLAEKVFIHNLITKVHPSGLVGVVSDSFDFWRVISEIAPELKETIMARDGKVVFRPDSGDPVDILCGEVIEDFSNKDYIKSIKDVKTCGMDFIREKVVDETPHGEPGPDTASEIFKFEDKYYKVTCTFFWNRYDKQYYYLDEVESVKIEEVTLTNEQKGAVQILWEQFGGTNNEKGYKELDSHVGLIYGDSITMERCEAICQRLKDKGFSSGNVVFGVGSFTYQMITRDTFGMAMKATYCEINGEGREIFKDPITDDGTKKSATGLLMVIRDEEVNDGELSLVDKVAWTHVNSDRNELKVVFEDGDVKSRQTLSEIRQRVADSF